jgi:hypothetical protein
VPGILDDDGDEGELGFADACGVVGVKRVASVADLDIGILGDVEIGELGW